VKRAALLFFWSFGVAVSTDVLADKPRARDLGVPFDGAPGAYNAITDVAGVTVASAGMTNTSGLPPRLESFTRFPQVPERFRLLARIVVVTAPLSRVDEAIHPLHEVVRVLR